MADGRTDSKREFLSHHDYDSNSASYEVSIWNKGVNAYFKINDKIIYDLYPEDDVDYVKEHLADVDVLINILKDYKASLKKRAREVKKRD